MCDDVCVGGGVVVCGGDDAEGGGREADSVAGEGGG